MENTYTVNESARELNLEWTREQFQKAKEFLEHDQDFIFTRDYEKFNKLKTVTVKFKNCDHNGTFILEDLLHLENIPVMNGKVCCIACARNNGFEGSYSVKERMAKSNIDFKEARRDKSKPAGIGYCGTGFVKDVLMKEKPPITQSLSLDVQGYTIEIVNVTPYRLLIGEYAGVYKITNTKDKKIYIGSSVNLYERLTTHVRKIINGNHDNKDLQEAVNEYGLEAFKFEIIEITPVNYQKHAERKYIELYKELDHPLYNVLTETMTSTERKEFKHLIP